MIKILVSLMLFFGISSADLQKEQIIPIMKDKIRQTIEILSSDKIDIDSKKNKIFQIFDPIFDYALISKLALGSKTYDALSENDKKRYTKAFENMLKNTYAAKLSSYNNESIVIDSSKEPKAKRFELYSHIESKSGRFDLVYKFHDSGLGWLIYDIDIAGVSIVQTYRNQFADILRTSTFDDLINKIIAEGK